MAVSEKREEQQRTPFSLFRVLAKRVVAVPKAEADKRQAAELRTESTRRKCKPES